MKHPRTARLGVALVGLGLVASVGLTTGAAPAPQTAPGPEPPAWPRSSAPTVRAGQELGGLRPRRGRRVRRARRQAEQPRRAGRRRQHPPAVFAPTDARVPPRSSRASGLRARGRGEVLAQVVKIAGSIDTIETILLYHVVAGKTLTSPKVLAAEGDKLTTAQGGTFRVHIGKGGVFLVDKDRDARQPLRSWSLDINRGNKQVAHGISQVLRPLDL